MKFQEYLKLRDNPKSFQKEKKNHIIFKGLKKKWNENNLWTVTFVAWRKCNSSFKLLRKSLTRICRLWDYCLGGFFHIIREFRMPVSFVFLLGWSRFYRKEFFLISYLEGTTLYLEFCELSPEISVCCNIFPLSTEIFHITRLSIKYEGRMEIISDTHQFKTLSHPSKGFNKEKIKHRIQKNGFLGAGVRGSGNFGQWSIEI